MSCFCEDGSEQLSNCHVFCRRRVRQQPAVALRWSRCGKTPTLPSAAPTLSPNTRWSQTPATERATAATRTTQRPATAPGKRRSNYGRCLTNTRITVHCTSVQLNCCHLRCRLPSVFKAIDYSQSCTA